MYYRTNQEGTCSITQVLLAQLADALSTLLLLLPLPPASASSCASVLYAETMIETHFFQYATADGLDTLTNAAI